MKENISLKKYNTFGIDVLGLYYQTFNSSADLELVFSNRLFLKKYIIIGSGSNLLFVNDYDGLILQSTDESIEIVAENELVVSVKVGSGLIWDKFVEWSVNKGFWGVENLSHIPGTIGASPVQNIGAYGVEASDNIECVDFFDPISNSSHCLTKAECNFGYRDSIFKGDLKEVIITTVTFKLSKVPIRKLEYKDIESYIEKNKITLPITLNAIREAIVAIRNAKLPNPEEIGNGGSFFKNPVIDKAHYESLKSKFSELPCYPISDYQVKVPAAWLIDKSGWKGFRRGDAGVHKNQALVLVNYGNATGKEIFDLSSEIINSVYDNFKISLEREIIIL